MALKELQLNDFLTVTFTCHVRTHTHTHVLLQGCSELFYSLKTAAGYHPAFVEALGEQNLPHFLN